MSQTDMQREEEDWVESTLQDAERRKCTRKVLSMQKLAAVAKGDNYASNLSRLRLKVQQIDGEVLDKWVIYKSLPDTEFRRKYIKESGLFIVEVRMYNEVLPMLEKIRREKEVGEPLWGECYGTKGYENILLEDLSVKGYKMGQRKKGVDFAHCSLVVRALAKYHALTVILKERGDLIISDYDKYFFEKNVAMLEKFYGYAFEELAQTIDKTWGPEWSCYAKALRNVKETLTENLLKNFAREDSQFNVLNHGDCWVNNILFKYDAKGKPVSLRFIDFQVSFYNSAGFDLQYFLNTSLDIEARSRTEELIQLYFESLTNNLQLFEYGGKMPTIEDINNCIKKASLFGLSSACSLLPLIMIKSEDVPDIEELLKKNAENSEVEFGVVPKDGEEYTKVMQFLLVRCKEKGILQV